MTSMTVNGEAVRFDLDPETPLLWALRDAANLTGTKYGCDSGECGACTVIIDGRAVKSCRATIQSLEGADITTIEGLPGGKDHPVMQAWAAEQVTQCGFCEPGMILSIIALLESNPEPKQADIDAIANLCSCGIGPRAARALARASQAARREQVQQRFSADSSRKEQGEAEE